MKITLKSESKPTKKSKSKTSIDTSKKFNPKGNIKNTYINKINKLLREQGEK